MEILEKEAKRPEARKPGGICSKINQNICNQIMDLSLKKISDPESFGAKFTSMSEQVVQEAESESGTCLKPGYHRYHLRMEER